MITKKGALFTTIVLLSFLAFLPISAALTSLETLQNDSLIRGVNTAKDKYETYNVADNKTEFLKQEWETLIGSKLNTTASGRVLLSINSFLKTTANPLFKMVLGTDYSLSWSFVFAVIIWFTLFFLLAGLFGGIFNKTIFAPIAAFAATSIIGISGAIKQATNMLTLAITNTWIAWLSLGIALVIALFAEILGAKISKSIKDAKKKEAERKEKENQEVLQNTANVGSRMLKGLSDGEGI